MQWMFDSETSSASEGTICAQFWLFLISPVSHLFGARLKISCFVCFAIVTRSSAKRGFAPL